MRDYGVISPKFWIGETGKALRGNAGAQVLALYLMTSPHANMIGVFHCPILYMAHETGLGMEGASKALQSLIEAGFCTFEEGSETVFVHRMAAYQVGEALKPGDNRIKAVARELAGVSNPQLRQAFTDRYGVAYQLISEPEQKAPSKPLRSQEQEQEQEQPSCPPAGGVELPGFAEFWKTWPSSDRKGGKGKCLETWKKAGCERIAKQVIAHVAKLKTSTEWTKDRGQYIPAPLVYLNGRRWDGAEDGQGSLVSEESPHGVFV